MNSRTDDTKEVDYVVTKKSAAEKMDPEARAFEQTQFHEVVHELQYEFVTFDVLRTIFNVFDGCKTSTRRILYGMEKMGARSDTHKMKSATVAGNIQGQLHPHGDDAIYGTMANLAQEEDNRRYPMINGQGAWGDVERDPAASRYTKCQLNQYADAMLGGLPGMKHSEFEINQRATPMVGAYMNGMEEPTILPALFPAFIVNGGEGLASGFSVKATSHNLSEVMDLALYAVDHKRIPVDKAREFVPGPDIPTGCLIYDEFDKDGNSGIDSYFERGEGTFRMVAKHHVEEVPGSSRRKIVPKRIVITALPFQAQPGMVVAGVKGLVYKGVLPDGITAVNATSGQSGLRIIVNIGTHDPEEVWKILLYHGNKAREEESGSDDATKAKIVGTTSLNYKYHVSMGAIERRPKVTGVIEATRAWLDHRRLCIRRRTKFKLSQIDSKILDLDAHIAAAPVAREIVGLLADMKRGSTKKEQAVLLSENFPLNESQAEVILDMTVSRIVSLDLKSLTEQREKLVPLQDEYVEILDNDNKVNTILRAEIKKVKAVLGDERRSEIMTGSLQLSKPVIAKEEIPVDSGYLLFTENRSAVRWITKRTANLSLTTPQGPITEIIAANTGLRLEGITDTGEHMRGVGVADINGTITPTTPLFAKVLPAGARVSNVFVCDLESEDNAPDVIMVTKNGKVKRVKGTVIGKHRRTRAATVVGLDAGDSVAHSTLVPTESKDDFVVALTDSGHAMKIPVSSIDAKGDKARGSAFLKLGKSKTTGQASIIHVGLYSGDAVLSYWTENNTVGSVAVGDIPDANVGTLGKKFTATKHKVLGVVAGTSLHYANGDKDSHFEVTVTPSAELGDRNIARSIATGIARADQVWSDLD